MKLKKHSFTYYYFKSILRDFYYRKHKFKKVNKLDLKSSQIVENLFKSGICLIEGYWDDKKCDKVRAQLSSKIEFLEKNKDFESGAYFRVKPKDQNYDQGVKRIYHVDKELKEIEEFKNDTKIKEIVNNYYGFPMYSSYTAFQLNMPSKIETRSFHIDGWDHEFKAFVYLEDVDISNGPFAYIVGSNNAYMLRYRRLIKDCSGYPDTSYNDIGKWVKKEKICIAKKGTLLLVDVRGLHRGLPQKEKSRTLIYNNYHTKNTHQFPEK